MGQGAPCPDYLYIPWRERCCDRDLFPLGLIPEHEGLAVQFLDIQLDLIPLFKEIIITLIDKCEGEDSEVYKVGKMDSCKVLCDHSLYPKIHRGKCGMLPAGTLSIVCTADNKPSSPLLCPLREGVVDLLKDIFRDGRYIGPQREDLGPCRHDMVCRDIVTDLDKYLACQHIRHGVLRWEGLYIRSPQYLHLLRFLRRGYDHRVVDEEFLRHRDGDRFQPEFSGVCNLAGNGTGSGDLRAGEIDLGILCPASAFKVSVEGGDRNCACRRCKTHPDAGSACALEEPCA